MSTSPTTSKQAKQDNKLNSINVELIDAFFKRTSQLIDDKFALFQSYLNRQTFVNATSDTLVCVSSSSSSASTWSKSKRSGAKTRRSRTTTATATGNTATTIGNNQLNKLSRLNDLLNLTAGLKTQSTTPPISARVSNEHRCDTSSANTTSAPTTSSASSTPTAAAAAAAAAAVETTEEADVTVTHDSTPAAAASAATTTSIPMETDDVLAADDANKEHCSDSGRLSGGSSVREHN